MVVDTSAMLSIILHEPDELAMATRLGEAVAAIMSAATYVELSILAKTRGRLGLDMLDSALAEASIEIVSVSVSQARLAAEAYARFGKGRGHPARLNYGDCFAYALAKERGEPLLFKGSDFARTDIAAAI
jgi:ribonuclease VapC